MNKRRRQILTLGVIATLGVLCGCVTSRPPEMAWVRTALTYRPAGGLCSLLDGLDARSAAEAAYAARASSA
jgi:hypothetical protein